jgi:hypothetical protein
MYDMEAYHSLFEQRRRIVSAVALTALGAQFVISLLMATTTSLHQEKASWNDAETQALVNYLWEHRAECGDGGSFKDTVYTPIPEQIAHLRSSGPAKNARQCKTKYNGVCVVILYLADGN